MSNKIISLLFTGQGSQHEGMGLDLINTINWAKDRYSLSSEILGYDVLKTQADPSKINLTQYSQPLIFIYSSIIIDFYKSTLSNKKIENQFNLAGHSLGEYLALYFAESLSFEDMLKLVSIRGLSMSKVSDPNKYGMYAILSKNLLDQDIFNDKVYLANINSENQVVICGLKEDLNRFKNSNQLGRYIPLNVSAPFHSPLMKDSSESFKEFAKSFNFKKSKYSLLSNHQLIDYQNIDTNNYHLQLSKQIFSTVEWRQTIKRFISLGIRDFYEIGPKKTLLSFIPKQDDINTFPLCSFEDINNYV